MGGGAARGDADPSAHVRAAGDADTGADEHVGPDQHARADPDRRRSSDRDAASSGGADAPPAALLATTVSLIRPRRVNGPLT